MEYLITTVPGLEDFVVEELFEKFNGVRARGVYMTGRVVASLDASPHELFKLKTVERFGVFLGDGTADNLRDVVQLAVGYLPKALRYLTKNTTVGVRTERVGVHSFTSKDVEREVGRWLKARGFVISLVDPDVEINVDVVDRYVSVWVTVAKKSLKDRAWRVYEHYASLNPIIANAMVRLARVKPGETVCDLTCGGGTIVAEAAALQPAARYLCIDISLRHVKGALQNVGWSPQVDILWFDSTKIYRILRPTCDKYIFNPPYGFRMPEKIDKLYSLLSKSMKHMAKNCAIYVVITPRHKTFLKYVEGEVLLKRVVYQGGLYSHIIMGRICR
jgi:tRNA (guanine6-N2)-methyltransferase